MRSCFLPLASLLLLTSWICAGSVRADALSASGVSGGLVVQVGCDDSLLPVALRPSDAYLVQVLDTSESRVAGLLNDIPGSDGARVYLRGAAIGPKSGEPAPHLYATAGFLDSSWFNRVHWRFGSLDATGQMVAGGDVACGVEVYSKSKSHGADSLFSPGSNAYSLLCWPVKKSATEAILSRNRQKLPKPHWVVQPEIRVSAIVRADDMLVVGGSPDVVDPADPHAAREGRKGGRLAIHDTSDGSVVDRVTLSAIPVWDGVAVAQGSLYIATENGAVGCLRGDKRMTRSTKRERPNE